MVRKRERSKSMTSSWSSSSSEAVSLPSPNISPYVLPPWRPDSPGMATPPINIPGAVAFRWEEAPGKPKRDEFPLPPLLPRRAVKPAEESKVLDLPPRLTVTLAEEMRVSRGRRHDRMGYEICRSSYYFWRRGRKVRRDERLDGIGVSPTLDSGWIYYNGVYDAETLFGCVGCGGSEDKEEEEGSSTSSKVSIMRRVISRSKNVSVLPLHCSTPHWLGNLFGNLSKIIPQI